MRHLLHPIRAIREPFGAAGLIIACVALVAALGGTALAASGALSGKQKKEVEKIAKKFAGKPGANGANGPSGPSGPAGVKGDGGATGASGAAGANGVSVTSESFTGTKEGHCGGQGGSKFVSSSGATFACNGTTGFTESLPGGSTETGVLFFEGTETAALSFSIPLEAGSVISAHFVKSAEGPPSGCTGGTFEAPSAAPGNLCVFQNEAVAVGTIEAARFSGIHAAGTFLELEFEGAGLAQASFAVTAPE
jgi:hypothetical protein